LVKRSKGFAGHKDAVFLVGLINRIAMSASLTPLPTCKKGNMMKALKLSTVLALVAIGSCAGGAGLEAAGSKGWGAGLSTLGTLLFVYLMFFHEE